MSQGSCQDRIAAEYASTMEDLHKLWAAYTSGDEEEVEDLGTFWEYGLCFDYVAPGTFADQEYGYFRYQLSWGGPSDEFRFYVDYDLDPYRIEYWFLDWFDGAHLDVMRRGRDRQLMEEIFDTFKEIGSVEAEYAKATQE